MKIILPIVLFVAGCLYWAFSGTSVPKPGEVFILTGDNFSTTKRTSRVMLGVYLAPNSAESLTLSRKVTVLSKKIAADRAILGLGLTDKEPGLVAAARIKEFPTMVVYRNGVEVDRVEGEFAPNGLDAMLKRNFSSLKQ